MKKPKPDTALLALAEQHGWRVQCFDDDGSGRVEIASGVFLDIAAPTLEGYPWKVGVLFDVPAAPRTAAILANRIGQALYDAAFQIQVSTTEE